MKNLVSHSNIKTKSTASANVQNKKLFSKALGRLVNLKVATSTIRDMEHSGGFDQYLLNQNTKKLSARALAVRKEIRLKMQKKAN